MKERAIVLWFNRRKGFGFLQPANGGSDIFVHYSGIVGRPGYRNLEADEVVEFDRQTVNGRVAAVNVVVIDAPEGAQ